MAYKKKLLTLAVAISSMAITACGTTTEQTSSKGGETTISSSQKTTSGQQSTSQTTPTSSSRTPSSSSAAPSRKKINLDLGDFVANVQDAKSLSIKNTKVSPKGLRRNAVSDDEDPVLVKSSVEYADDGSIVNENGEVEVSFKKITTTTKTTEINGQEAYIPYEDGTREGKVSVVCVSFDADADKGYHLFDEDGVCVAFDVADNGDKDIDKTTGKIAIEVEGNNKEYSLKSYVKKDLDSAVYNAGIQITTKYETYAGSGVYICKFTFYDNNRNESYLYEVYDSNEKLVLSFNNSSYYYSSTEIEVPEEGYYTIRGYKTTDGFTAPIDVGPLTSKEEEIDAILLDYAISFNTNEGFDYKICDVDGTVLVDNLTDNCEQDLEEKEDIIKVKGFEKNKTYLVKYHGFGEETEVSQESVGADIDKTYVYSSQFTFISFVPVGESKRPTGKDLIIDSDGVASYDKKDFYSDDYRQSFLIDNYTGLVYKIENFKIAKIEKRVIFDSSNKAYGFRINANDDLEIFQIVKNETIQYVDIFGDRFNQYYVKTIDFTGVDTANKTCYFTNNKYMYAQDGNVLKLKYDSSFYHSTCGEIKNVTKTGPEFTDIIINDDETIKVYSRFSNDINSGRDISNTVVTEIRGGYIYFVCNGGWAHVSYYRALVNQPAVTYGMSYGYQQSIMMSDVGDMWSSNTQWPIMITDNIVLLYSDIEGALNDWSSSSPTNRKMDHFNLYFAYIWEVEDPNSGAAEPVNTLYRDTNVSGMYMTYDRFGKARTLLLENCVSPGDGWGNENCSFDQYKTITAKQTTFTETIYWKVVMDNGYPEVVNSATYVAPENTSVIIQPINR